MVGAAAAGVGPVNVGLEGKRILITGASRGIGRAIALLYACEKPALLCLVSRSIDKLNEVAEECQKRGAKKVEVLKVDVSKLEDVKKIAMDMLSNKNDDGYGVDVLVNNAGVLIEGSAVTGDVDEWTENVNINLMAPMILTRLLSHKMQERQFGTIINIGSVAAIDGMLHNGLYSATKFGLRGWSLHTYQKLRHDNIKVMIIHPGFVSTDMTKHPDRMSDLMIQPEDIAEVAMLPFRTSAGCCPEEITLRLTRACTT
eukprot:GHVS01029477.1.p1 GENE.GHVS01029477.1~~GHVS01029477.1.p1  ORF type:complete len:257 (+),score=32.95 GHVS01029477.1:161-931(+)